MQDLRAIFGRNVRRYRQQKNATQEELAFEAKIDQTYLRGI
jgi:transcriptional regulator with XRE-family HTH domain